VSRVGFAAAVGSHLQDAEAEVVEPDDETDGDDVHECTKVDASGPWFEEVVLVLSGVVCGTRSFTFDELVPL
jgi:hypothetical protein